MKENGFVTTDLRFSSLLGYDRLPGNYLASRKEVSIADVPVNLIHRDDCVEIIYELTREDVWGEVFNAYADEHPFRRDYNSAIITCLNGTIFHFSKEFEVVRRSGWFNGGKPTV